ncbi:MAG: MBL fold metallo-hydrolase [Planctomycetes bacterium]|nr:MBL fold metallo-hydrolase [Planctomycetota bacterium]
MIEALSHSIYRLSYDVPLSGVPPVNVYALLGERPALVDCGPAHEETFRQLQSDLESLGTRLSDLTAILLTHHHVDHAGLASRLAAESEATIYLHPDDWEIVTWTSQERAEFARELKEIVGFWGVPRMALDTVGEMLGKVLRLGGDRLVPEKLTPYPDGPFTAGELEFVAIHCPGHTKGQVCLWSREDGILFTSDHVLEDITSNPSLYIPRYRGRRCGLTDYLESLGRVAGLSAHWIFPGHGKPFRDVRGRVEAIRKAAAERKGKILSVLDGAPSTILGLTGQVWGELTPMNTFLGAREVHGHLEIMLEEGAVRLFEEEGVGLFERRQ